MRSAPHREAPRRSLLSALVAGLSGLGVLVAGGCGRRVEPAAQQLRLPAPTVPEGEVVATVNGRPISSSDVATQARATGKAPAEALQELVRAELLAEAADGRGLVADPEVQRRGRQEMVRRYLQATFEKDVTPDSAVSGAELRRAYLAARPRLIHPLLKQVRHILVRGRGKEEQAAALAEELRGRALTTDSAEAFKGLAKELDGRAKAAGLELTEELVTTARENWTEEPFAKAAFELPRLGAISPVTRTSYGFHVLRLEREIPAENISYEEAAETIRKDLYPRARSREFQRFVDGYMTSHQVTQHPERLAELQQAER